MLVIYSCELPVEQILPVEFSVRIPARAGEPTAVAVLDGNSLVTNEYSRTENGDWAEITLVSDSTFIQIEYYNPALSQSDQPRTFEYVWDFDYPINDLIVSFKQPLNASDVVLQPELGSAQAGSDGLNTYTTSFGSLPAGEAFKLEISYSKPDTALFTVPPSPPASESQTAESASPGIQSELPAWGWVLIGAGVVVLSGGAVYFLRGKQSLGTNSRYRQKKQRSGKTAGKDTFCHECGVKARPGDKFCRECGTKLRL